MFGLSRILASFSVCSLHLFGFCYVYCLALYNLWFIPFARPFEPCLPVRPDPGGLRLAERGGDPLRDLRARPQRPPARVRADAVRRQHHRGDCVC